MRRDASVVAVGIVLLHTGCGSSVHLGDSDASQGDPLRLQMNTTQFAELLPGVRINRKIRTVEFDAVVAVDCHHPETPDVYLEVVCCTPDTREHEALVVTTAPPSSIHAALLALGAEPGRPGGWRREDGDVVPVAPEGDRVRVWFITDTEWGGRAINTPEGWIVRRNSRQTLGAEVPESGWAFAGSRMREFRGREVYDADGTGQLIGLHTFGSETIAWNRVESPEASVQEPLWLANNDVVPRIGTPVTVRISLEPERSPVPSD